MRMMRSSRGVNEASTSETVSRRFDWIAASIGWIAFLSSMKSPRCESLRRRSVFRATRFLSDLQRLATFPAACRASRRAPRRRLAPELVDHLPGGAHDLVDGLGHVNRHTDGARLVRSARVTACRIHQVA